MPKDRSFRGFLQTGASAEKQKVNLNWLTFNYFVDNDDYLSNFLEGLVKLDRFKESVWKHIF